MTEVYTASTVLDIVDALPTLFGFTPTESFIGITTSGPRRRFGFRLRLDIPEASEAAGAGEVIASHLNTNGGDGVILIALSNDRARADAITNAVLDHLGPVEVVAALHADAHHVWTYDSAGVIDDTEPGLARYTGAVSAAIVQAVAAGQQIWGSREALAEVFAPSATLTDVTGEVDAVNGGGEAAAEMLAVTATDVLTTYAKTRGALPDEHIRTLAVAAQFTGIRDHLWGLMTCTHAEAHAEATHRHPHRRNARGGTLRAGSVRVLAGR